MPTMKKLKNFIEYVLIEREYLTISILSLIIFIIGLQITPGLSPDSTRYIAVAEKIVSEGLFYPIALHSEPIASYSTSVSPPLFEYLISGFLLLGFEKLTAGGMVSLIFLVLLPFPIYYLAKEVGNRNIGYLSVLCFISMASTWYVSTWIWTEATFVFLNLSALYFCVKYLKTDDTENLFLCSFFCMLSCLTRWVGIILGISIITVLFYDYYKNNRHSGVLLSFYSIISFLPVGLLLLKNIIFEGDPYPNSGPLGQFSDVFITPFKSIITDFLFPEYSIINSASSYQLINLILQNKISELHSINFKFSLIDGILIFSFIITLFLLISVIIHYGLIKEKILNERKIFISPLILYTVFYLLGIMFLKSVAHFDELDTRLLFPIYPLILIIFIYIFYITISSLPEPKKVQFRNCFFVLLVLFLVFQTDSSSALLLEQKDGKGYSSPEIKFLTNSDSFVFLESNWNKADPIFTNVDIYAMKYYLDSYLNENIFEINENIFEINEAFFNINENMMTESSDSRVIFYIQADEQDNELQQILENLSEDSIFIRCIKDENYELWVNKKMDNESL